MATPLTVQSVGEHYFITGMLKARFANRALEGKAAFPDSNQLDCTGIEFGRIITGNHGKLNRQFNS